MTGLAAERNSPLGWLVAGMNACGSVLILLIMAVILDIGGRFIANRPLPGTPEIVSMSIAVIVFLQFPATLRAGRVIAADGLLDLVGRRSVRWEQWLQATWHLLGAAIFAVVCRHVFRLTLGAWESGDYYGSLSVFPFAKWPVFAIIAFGCGLMSLQYLLLAHQYRRAGAQGRRLIEVDPASKVMS